MGKITSIVGLVLIVAAGVLAAVSTNYQDQIKAKQKICSQYINSAKEALKKGDKDKASEFANKAFKVDPNNKALYELLKEIHGASEAKTASKKPAPKKTISIDLGC
jgi:Tfp pilus assembly protein PilF